MRPLDRSCTSIQREKGAYEVSYIAQQELRVLRIHIDVVLVICLLSESDIQGTIIQCMFRKHVSLSIVNSVLVIVVHLSNRFIDTFKPMFIMKYFICEQSKSICITADRNLVSNLSKI